MHKYLSMISIQCRHFIRQMVFEATFLHHEMLNERRRHNTEVHFYCLKSLVKFILSTLGEVHPRRNIAEMVHFFL